MEEFKLSINIDKFRSTNGIWNNLMLNDPWSVGYVSQLIERKKWVSKEEWEEFYYSNGEERRNLMSPAKSVILNNDSLQLNNKSFIQNLPWDDKNLNYHYGRTKEDLMEKAKKLNVFAQNLTLEECFECVRFRTICETWNGIIIRENNTIRNLLYIFPNFVFKKTNGDIDHTYAVDYEVYFLETLKCGIQIKPKSYTFNTPYLQKAKYANQQKNDAYQKKYNVPVFTVISTSKGEILNNDIIKKIEEL